MGEAGLKILLLGKNGQVGWELQRSLSVLGEVVAPSRNSGDLCGDLSNLKGLVDTVLKVQPQIIVNAAAYTAVDKAESEEEVARSINALAPGKLAEAAQKISALLIHYSTDYVFDGSGSQPWLETDKPSPINIYGKTKLEGETAITDSGCRFLIFRTSWVYASRGRNFCKTILRLAQEKEQLSIISDQIGAPTGAELIADITVHAIRSYQDTGYSDNSTSGIYHLVADGETSWYGYARFLLETAANKGVVLSAGPDDVVPVSTSSYPTEARRPLNSRLDTHRLQSTFNLRLPQWQEGVMRMLTEVMEKTS